MLRVVGMIKPASVTSRVEVDGFLPLKFQTYTGFLDDRAFVLINTGKTQLIDLAISSNSMVLRGFKIVSVKRMSRTALRGPNTEDYGLPILGLPRGAALVGSPLPRVDVPLAFSVFVGADTVEVQFEGHWSFDSSLRYGDASFRVSDGNLVGFGVQNLSPAQVETFADNLYPPGALGTANRQGLMSAAIRRALFEEWEPTRGRDENGGNIYPILRLLNLRSSRQEIVDHLWWVETASLELPGNRRATEFFAERLMRIPDEVEVALRTKRH